ncbi:Sfi1p NDAI_0C02430 [Naumovozyma dairenensis CBS 421]|uniref:Spindle body associated protein C-terminal domain-containing protein n=1 Tax=Naumovozyma dairenensis (strain ATCC 10597 / BCRC 20456 / CBS 421 / NBRC 0211 / NRRL Y-12639) TaxID=1071378 RepID=G0W7Z2_NAUDC|nr:hypothetical protein NDAI_0C02430 [Naumovozyma dairenensis CBS 421]CCD23903.1 hypothetical protein NDAI_0C02430 [Naumovozyma dairenensis CBS 421]
MMSGKGHEWNACMNTWNMQNDHNSMVDSSFPNDNVVDGISSDENEPSTLDLIRDVAFPNAAHATGRRRMSEPSHSHDSNHLTDNLLSNNIDPNGIEIWTPTSTDALIHKPLNELLRAVHLSPRDEDPNLMEDRFYHTMLNENDAHYNRGDHVVSKVKFADHNTTNDFPSNIRRHSVTFDTNSALSKDYNNKDIYPNFASFINENGSPLQILYNKIQVFLIRNKISLEFLKIFRNYIYLLEKNNENPENDQFVLRLQNELSRSYRLTSEMKEILSIFILNPSTLLTKLAHWEYNKDENIKRNFLKFWLQTVNKKLKLQYLEIRWNEYLKTKWFNFWNFKYTQDIEMISKDAIKFDNERQLIKAWDLWERKIFLYKAQDSLANKYFLEHVFNRTKRNFVRIKQLKEKSVNFHNKLLKKDVIRTWQLKRIQKTFDKKLNENRLNCMFRKIIKKWDVIKIKKERATVTNIFFQRSHYLKIWTSNTEKSQIKINELVSLENRFIKQTKMNNLKNIMKRKKQEYITKEKLDDILLCFIFNHIWRRRYTENVDCLTLLNINEKKLLKRTLTFWKQNLHLRLKADEMFRKNNYLQYIKKWKIQSRLAHLESEKNRKLFIDKFGLWHKKLSVNKQYRKYFKTVVLRRGLKKWTESIHRTKRLNSKAIAYNKNKLQLRYFRKWLQSKQGIIENDEKARLFHKLKIILKIKKCIQHIKNVKILSDKIGSSFVRNRCLQKYYSLWREKRYENYKARLISLGKRYENHLHSKIKSKYFTIWGQQYRLYTVECGIRGQESRNLFLKKFAMRLIKEQMIEKENLSIMSLQYDISRLKIKVFLRWHNHLSYLVKLNEIANDKINEDNIHLLQDYTKNWSMKFMRIQKNEESVPTFRKRWDRATVRGIFMLWKNKLKNFERNLEAIPNGTPNFKTPRKSIMGTSSTIPGSERMKDSKMKAMMNHYSKARRAIPSPLKTSSSLNLSARKKIEGRSWEGRSPSPTIHMGNSNTNDQRVIRNNSISLGDIADIKPKTILQSRERTPVKDLSSIDDTNDTRINPRLKGSPTRRNPRLTNTK